MGLLLGITFRHEKVCLSEGLRPRSRCVLAKAGFPLYLEFVMESQTHLPSRTVPADIENEVARALRAYVGYLEMRQSRMEIDCLLRWAMRGLFIGAALAVLGYAALYPTSGRSVHRVPHLFGPQRVRPAQRAPDFITSTAHSEEIRSFSQD